MPANNFSESTLNRMRRYLSHSFNNPCSASQPIAREY